MPWYFLFFYFAGGAYALVSILLLLHGAVRIARRSRPTKPAFPVTDRDTLMQRSGRAEKAWRRMADLLEGGAGGPRSAEAKRKRPDEGPETSQVVQLRNRRGSKPVDP